jgi:hypothetical protein
LVKTIKFLKPFDANKIVINQHPHFSDVYLVELPLDSTPEDDWKDTFEQKWKSSRDLWDRKLYLVDDKIRLLSTVDYFDEKLDWMQKMIEDTNRSVEEYNKAVEKESEMIKDETTKQLLQTERNQANVIMDAVLRKFA